MRRAANRDQNERRIVDALRAMGCTVQHLSAKDCPDLLVGYRGRTYLMEVKRPPGVKGGASEDGQKLSPGQQLWHERWRGSPVHVVRTVDEALSVVGAVSDAPRQSG